MAHPQDVQSKAIENFTFYLYSFFHYKINENSVWLVAWTFARILIFVSSFFVLILLLMVSLPIKIFCFHDFVVDVLVYWIALFSHIEGILLFIPPLQYLLYHVSWGDIPWSCGINFRCPHDKHCFYLSISEKSISLSFMNVLHPWCVQTLQFTLIKPFCNTEILLTFYNGTENESAY